MNKIEVLAHIFNQEITEDIGLVELSQGHYAIVDKEDEEKINKHKWFAVVDDRKYVKTVHGKRTLHKNGKSIGVYLHRAIMDAPVGLEVDHKNGEQSDNRKSNLRLATHTQNVRNRRFYKGEAGYKGVVVYTTKSGEEHYTAQIKANKKQYNLGTYNTPEEAALAYNKEAVKQFGEYACLNKVVM